MTTQKQTIANRQNSKLSTGPKTEQGKNVAKFNSLRHGILQKDLTEYESSSIDTLKQGLFEQEKPSTIIEEIILERIALHTIRLKRIVKAESEYIKAVLNPPITKTSNALDSFIDSEIKSVTVVIEEGYKPLLNVESVETLLNTYARYETGEESRLFRAINQLLALRALSKK